MYRRCSLTGMRSVSRACAAQMCARTHIRMHVLTQAHTYARIVSRSVLPTCATHCNILQHTATHCNTLQHTATHCRQTQEWCPGVCYLHHDMCIHANKCVYVHVCDVCIRRCTRMCIHVSIQMHMAVNTAMLNLPYKQADNERQTNRPTKYRYSEKKRA